MNSLVGFTVHLNLSENRIKAVNDTQARALAYFEHLDKQSVTIGETKLEIWGHGDVTKCLHTLPDGSLLALVGSPQGRVDWDAVQESIHANTFELPWDGRVILLRVSSDGKRWEMWNDWLGSIPVFHAEIERGRIASTLEPVVVASAGYTSDDFFLPGLVSLLMNGHFISDWTLYKGMKVIPPDSVMNWDENGFRSKCLWTVKPSQDRWDAGWDDLVDEMHALSYQAVADVLKTQPNWVLPLSAGLDSRLIAAVGADVGANFQAYAWGEPESTDVVYSRKISKILGIPWKRVDMCSDFLECYTPLWADLFGSSMHFHGMYQMCFLDALKKEPGAPLITGYVGDVLSGSSLMEPGPGGMIYRKEWYLHWDATCVERLLKVPFDNALQEIAEEVEKLVDLMPGPGFSKTLMFELWSRQRLFTSFQVTLSSYWRGMAAPFLNRAYARFCMSLPRAVHEGRRLLGDVFRRYYGRLAVVPGTYASQPYILTGRYLLKHRIVERLPAHLHRGPFAGFDDVPLRMDMDCIRMTGKESLWPLFNAGHQLSQWLDVNLLEKEYHAILQSKDDIRPLRRLQSAQTLAYRLLSE